MCCRTLCWIFFLPFAVSVSAEGTPLAEHVDRFLVSYCLDCHDADSEKGDINLDFTEIDWNDPHAAITWAKAWDMIAEGGMPPEEKDQPTQAERDAVAAWLETQLLENDKPGGTVIRRLSREEYENSVSDALKIAFKVPRSFPSDPALHGFDNNGEDLFLSPPLMAQYLEIATAAADRVLPPPLKDRKIEKETTVIGPEDFTLNFTTGHEIDGVLRMNLSSDPLARGSVWLNRFEAKVSGVYRIRIDLSPYKPDGGHVPLIHLLAHEAGGNNYARASELPLLAEFELKDKQRKTYQADVELQRGQTIVVHYENAPLNSDQDKNRKWQPRVAGQLVDMFRADPEPGGRLDESRLREIRPGLELAGENRSDSGTGRTRRRGLRSRRTRGERIRFENGTTAGESRGDDVVLQVYDGTGD